MKYFLITGKLPANETEPERNSKIEIGETNPFDSSGKPFKVTYHENLGINTLDDWKRLINLYGTRITHEYIKTPEGLRQDRNSEVVPAFHLISLLHDGFSKYGEGEKIIYFKQKGRIEDETGKTTFSPDEMIAILESK